MSFVTENVKVSIANSHKIFALEYYETSSYEMYKSIRKWIRKKFWIGFWNQKASINDHNSKYIFYTWNLLLQKCYT